MEKKRRTEIAELGEFGLIDLLTRGFDSADASTLRAAGDDAAIVMPPSGEAVLCSTDALLEGIDFDLTYFPLRHLGYKAVTVAASDILAMNALPSQLMVSLGVSSKLSVEALQELYEGIAFACREQGIDLVGGDTKASMTGLVLGLTALGHAPKEKVVSRGGAQQNDLICISGNLGAAYMGLRLLEREKRVLADVKDPEPKFAGYEYLLEKYLKPRLRKDIVEALAEEGIVPTSMIDLSDGLSSDLMQICKASKCGARIYLDRIPIARQTYALAEEMNADPVVAALNGGEDHELLFTVPLALQEQVMRMGCVDVIGHITPESTGGIPGDARRRGYPPQGPRLSRKGVIPGTDPGFPGRSEAAGGSGGSPGRVVPRGDAPAEKNGSRPQRCGRLCRTGGMPERMYALCPGRDGG